MTKKNNNQLVFVPLGGTGEIGMNMNCYGYGNDIEDMKWLLVDVGITFGDDSLGGVDIITANHGFIKDRKDDLEGIIITHAHEDHVGGLAYLWPDLKCQIYATPFTASIIRLKFEERGVDIENYLTVVDLGSEFNIDPFKIRIATMTHSIPEPNSLFITTPAGTIFHTGDWKIDENPMMGKPIDFKTLNYDKKDILAMVCDSTNVVTEGRSGSESTVRENLVKLVKSLQSRVFITSFASNVTRLETVAVAAKKSNRSLVVLGRSMHRMISVAKENGILENIDVILSEKEARKKKKEDLLYLCTGSQGEPRGAMMRIANRDFNNVEIDPGDTVIFSSKIIPGNEKKLFSMFNRLSELGVDVITEYDEDIHVSGHPCKEEVIDMYKCIKPQISVPVHGEYRHLKTHSNLAKELNIKHPMLITNGDILKLAPGSPQIIDQCYVGRLYLDGNRMVDSDSYHLNERRIMNFNGSLNVTCVLDKKFNLKQAPIISTYGVISDNDNEEEILEILEDQIYDFFGDSKNFNTKDKKMYKKLETLAKNTIFKATRKKPLTNIEIVRI